MASWWSILGDCSSAPNTSKTYLCTKQEDLHIILQRNLTLLVSDDWEAQLTPRDLIDVFDPTAVALDRVCAQAYELDTPLREFWLKFCECAKLGGADLRDLVS